MALGCVLVGSCGSDPRAPLELTLVEVLFPEGPVVAELEVADIDGDGVEDLLVGTLGSPGTVQLLDPPRVIADVELHFGGSLDISPDVTGDGLPDLLILHPEPRLVSPRTLEERALPAGFHRFVPAPDQNGDGLAEVVGLDADEPVVVLLSTDGEELARVSTSESPGDGCVRGESDLLLVYRWGWEVRSLPDLGLREEHRFVEAVPGRVWCQDVGFDLDGEGLPNDAIHSEWVGDGQVYKSEEARWRTVDGNGRLMVAPDYDGDGIPELATVTPESNQLRVFWGDTLTHAFRDEAPLAYHHILLGTHDVDGNGRPELLVGGVRVFAYELSE